MALSVTLVVAFVCVQKFWELVGFLQMVICYTVSDVWGANAPIGIEDTQLLTVHLTFLHSEAEGTLKHPHGLYLLMPAQKHMLRDSGDTKTMFLFA